MIRSVRSTVIRLVVWSLVIGIVLSVTGVSPEALLSGLGDTVERIFAVVVDMARWAVPYVLLGAVVVIPVWLVAFAWRLIRRRGSGA
jgi:hypothetical protein